MKGTSLVCMYVLYVYMDVCMGWILFYNVKSLTLSYQQHVHLVTGSAAHMQISWIIQAIRLEHVWELHNHRSYPSTWSDHCYFISTLQSPFTENSELQQRTARMLSMNTWDVAVSLTHFDWTIFNSIHEVSPTLMPLSSSNIINKYYQHKIWQI